MGIANLRTHICRAAWIALAGLLVISLRAQTPASPPPASAAAQLPSAPSFTPNLLRGFTPQSSTVEAAWEERFLALPQPASLRQSLRVLTAQPHMAGTPADRANAEYVAGVFRASGWSTRIVRYLAWLPYPRLVRVTAITNHRQLLPNYEAPIAGDRFSAMNSAVIGFNAYSPSGDVTAPVVYVNYGLPEDYAVLKQDGISVRGDIVLARYGKSYRGIKAQLAAAHGAVGCLLYSDPNDDGFHAGLVYPQGAWRPASGIQRGSILNNNYPGAPLKPGQAPPAWEAAAWKAALPTIPTAPLSWQAAAPILEALAGRPAPQAWQGGLPVTYHFGGTLQVQAHIHLVMSYKYRTIWDVIGTMRGRHAGEVLIGNHRDAWTFGAVDPNSGTMVLLALARGLGHLYAQGWRPRRTIKLCSWDAEEFALIGSTDYAERHTPGLRRKAVAYFNLDEGDYGPNFTPGAVPSLRRLIYSVARAVPAPPVTTTGSVFPLSGCAAQTVFQAWSCASAAQPVAVPSMTAPASAPVTSTLPRINVIGGGSDFEPFLDHVGIATADISFSGPYGVYHSLYDDFHYFKTEADPHFDYGVACTRVLGLLTLRMADARLLPLDLPDYAQAIMNYLQAEQTRAANTPAASLNWARVTAAAEGLERAAVNFTTRAQAALNASVAHPHANAANLARFNQTLAGFEQTLLHHRGLPGRPFYKNLIFAPSITNGYSTARLPGLAQRLREKNWAGVSVQLRYLYQALENATTRLKITR